MKEFIVACEPESSNVSEIGDYNGELAVRFLRAPGVLYVYRIDASESIERLMMAESVGRELRSITKGIEFNKVKEEEEQ